MTTTDLIKLLQDIEKGASGRSREISFYIEGINGTVFVYHPEIVISSTGDGYLGSMLSLLVKTNEELEIEK